MNPIMSAHTMYLPFMAQSTARMSFLKGSVVLIIFLVLMSHVRTVLSAPAETNSCELGEAHAPHNSSP